MSVCSFTEASGRDNAANQAEPDFNGTAANRSPGPKV